MSHELGQLRAGMIAPYWAYLDRSFDLEYHVDRACGVDFARQVKQDLQELDAELAALDSRDREAILSVLSFEVKLLVQRCTLEAKHLCPLKRAKSRD
jgi:hypothetical protein